MVVWYGIYDQTVIVFIDLQSVICHGPLPLFWEARVLRERLGPRVIPSLIVQCVTGADKPESDAVIRDGVCDGSV